MRCRVEKCFHNNSGYCMVSSYVEIDPNGNCSKIFENEDNDEDDEYE